MLLPVTASTCARFQPKFTNSPVPNFNKLDVSLLSFFNVTQREFVRYFQLCQLSNHVWYAGQLEGADIFLPAVSFKNVDFAISTIALLKFSEFSL